MISTKHRSDQKEWMDDLEMSGPELRDTLHKLGRINHYLGGNRVTRKAVWSILMNKTIEGPLRLLDLGCGHGEQLRYLIDFGRTKGITIQATGIDANQDCIDYAIECSANYPEIRYLKQDAFSQKNLTQYDIVLATLFLHHLKNDALLELLKMYTKKATTAVIINDLHRSKCAYVLFYLVGLFIKNNMIVHDGLVSILRGFKRKELIAFSNKLDVTYSLKWMWAFRFQWILYTNGSKNK